VGSSKELTVVQAAEFFSELAEAAATKVKHKPNLNDLDQVAQIFGDDNYAVFPSAEPTKNNTSNPNARVIELRKQFTHLYNQIRQANQRILSRQGDPIALKALPLSASEKLIEQRIEEMENALADYLQQST
jgi:hypothetical protein